MHDASIRPPLTAHQYKTEEGGGLAFDAARQCTHHDPAVVEAVYDVLLDADLDREEEEGM